MLTFRSFKWTIDHFLILNLMRVIADFANPVKVEFYCKGLYMTFMNCIWHALMTCRRQQNYSNKTVHKRSLKNGIYPAWSLWGHKGILSIESFLAARLENWHSQENRYERKVLETYITMMDGVKKVLSREHIL